MSRKMKPAQFRLPRSIAVLALAAGTSHGWAQYVDWPGIDQNPGLGNYVPKLKYVKTDVEAEQDVYSGSGGGQQKTDRFYVAPAFGIGWDNYIYHPYLLTYSLLFEPSYVWQESGSSGQMSQMNILSLNGNFTANVLQTKSYATTLSYSRSRDEVKYDLFNSATVDSQGWGVNSGYTEGPVPVNVSFQQSRQDSSSIGQDSTTDQTTVNLRARNERQKENTTDLNYQYGLFNRQTDVAGSSYTSENSYQNVNLTDMEHFQKSALRSAILFNDIESQNSSSSDLNAALDYSVEHTPHLQGNYQYALSRYGGDGSDSIQNYASAGIRHQLYDSLTSTLEVHGSTLNSSFGGSTLDSTAGGGSGSLNYTKRLSAWAQLTLGNSASYNLTDQQTSGSEVVVPNESYTVPASGPTIIHLNQPREISITSVMNSTGTIILQRDPTPGSTPGPGYDYSVDPSTDPWQIAINTAGPNHIPRGAAIQVTYTVQSNPSGSYSTFNDDSQVRLDFWGGLVGIYTRYNFADNHADTSGFVLQNDQEFQAGADFNWRGLSLTADYTDNRSSFYDNYSYNLAESYGFNLSSRSTLGIDLNQNWSTYSFSDQPSASQQQKTTFFNYMVRYEWRPTSQLNWNSEVGLQQQHGSGVDQNLFAARTYLNWAVAKLEVHLGYEHQDQDFNGQIQKRDFVFFRVRRNF
jgi:hypothetical protein